MAVVEIHRVQAFNQAVWAARIGLPIQPKQKGDVGVGALGLVVPVFDRLVGRLALDS